MEIDFQSHLYPRLLKIISNPPKKLYAKGNLDLLSKPIISIVGSRACSQNGITLAKKFAYELSQCGLTIASGLAKGIDSAAHLYSYKELGHTIAVLPCGFNHIFPKENIGLYQKILDNGGLAISEYPPDIKAKSQYFLARNRIVSGISVGVLVVEAAYRSGTSVTAKLASKQGRKVFALPHEIWDLHGVGTNRLLKNGSILVTCVEDILEELSHSQFFDILMFSPNKSLNIHKFNINSKIVNEDFVDNLDSPDISRSSNKVNFEEKKRMISNSFENPDYQLVYNLIFDIPISTNEICKRLNKPINIISNILFSLELDGYIKKVAGGYICILDN